MILITCSGSVGRATLAYTPHLNTLISHDLLRIEAGEEKYRGWLYAFLRSATARAMMTSVQYGHIIKHLEVSHLNTLPIPELPDPMLAHFTERTIAVLDLREKAYAVTLEAEKRFENCLGPLPTFDNGEAGFIVHAAEAFFFGIVRLTKDDENYVADQVEQAAEARAQADLLENAMADEAEQILSRFIAGET